MFHASEYVAQYLFVPAGKAGPRWGPGAKGANTKRESASTVRAGVTALTTSPGRPDRGNDTSGEPLGWKGLESVAGGRRITLSENHKGRIVNPARGQGATTPGSCWEILLFFTERP